MRILLVEDDEVIAGGLRDLLEYNGYVVDVTTSIHDAAVIMDVELYDGLIVDRGLPDGDGLSIVTAARTSHPTLPILVLTARHHTTDIVSGLDHGADDYLAKPFLPDVLLARLRALLRRADRPADAPEISFRHIRVNTNSRTVHRHGKEVSLSPREYQLFEYLLRQRGKAIDRQDLLDHVWGDETDMFSNTVDVHIRYLRMKLDTPGEKSVITTVRGKGYMVCTD